VVCRDAHVVEGAQPRWQVLQEPAHGTQSILLLKCFSLLSLSVTAKAFHDSADTGKGPAFQQLQVQTGRQVPQKHACGTDCIL
jgi:hypothetical protein